MPLIRKNPDQPPPAGEPAAQASLTLLTSGTTDERWAAARAAAQASGNVERLGEALRVEEDPRVREAILTSLSRIGSIESAAAVLPHLRSDDSSLRTGALDALRAMPTAAAAHLPALLEDADADVRLLACELARGLPSAEASAQLCALLDREEEVNVCAAAVDVLAEAGGPEALPALSRCGARFRDEPFLGFAIRVAAERAGAQRAPRE